MKEKLILGAIAAGVGVAGAWFVWSYAPYGAVMVGAGVTLAAFGAAGWGLKQLGLLPWVK